jgi:hypothetical protein
VVLAELFVTPDRIDYILGKILTANDDSGRHGILIPREAYDLFPEFAGFEGASAINYTTPIATVWRSETGTEVRKSNFKHYHRYPERRITALRSKRVDAAPADTLVVIGRRTDGALQFEIVILYPTDENYSDALAKLGIIRPTAGALAVLRDWTPAFATAPLSPAVRRLLTRFDKLTDEGWVPSLRAGGNRGVGNTFEIRMGGSENNLAAADVDGVELKSMLRKEYQSGVGGDADLFLKEPKWIDGLTEAVDRIRNYGYIDEDGRSALYSGVKTRPNSHHLSLNVDRTAELVLLTRNGAPIGSWEFATLATSLRDKLHETLYALADSKRLGDTEAYRYHSLFYCSRPSIDGFVRLIDENAVSLQLRMHINEAGPRAKARNHGSQFRVASARWSDLFATVRRLR